MKITLPFPLVLLSLILLLLPALPNCFAASVEISAVAQKSPAQITLSWSDQGASYTIYRTTSIGNVAGSWGAPIASGITGSTFTDTNVVAGVAYDYYLIRTGWPDGKGYIHTGIELPTVEDRGNVLLVVDDTISVPLEPEITRLEEDLTGDGWTVVRRNVSRADTPPNIRAIIQAAYNSDPVNTKALLLLGHVPIAYSGWMNPDGHGSRPGPTDAYYADVNGTWTDTSVNGNSSSGNYPWWKNTPGDGKFDQNVIPSETELETGRVDFENMPAFQAQEGLSEIDLLRRYLNKDHQFRHKVFSPDNKGADMQSFTGRYMHRQFFWPAVTTNVPFVYHTDGVAPNSPAYSPEFFNEFETNSYLWFTKGGGGGNYEGTSGIGQTQDFAVSTGVKVVFHSWFASYYWEWDVKNAFLRAPLAGKGYGLTNFWSERPTFPLVHMAMGKNIGYSVRVTQNNNSYYDMEGHGSGGTKRGIHINLEGDPTLRMHVVRPVSNLGAVPGPGSVALTWTASLDANQGYNVYRSDNPEGPFARLNTVPVSGTSYANPSVAPGTYTYMVRALRLETTASGTYVNQSQGIFQTTTVGSGGGGGGTGSEYTVNANTIALYHFNGNYNDATANAFHLTAAGGVTRTSANLGWMSTPSGEVARVTAIGDTLTASIPDASVQPGSTASPLILEARIYPRAYKAYGVGNYPIISLNQAWDSKIELLDGIWNNPKAPTVTSGQTTLVTNAQWNSSVSFNSWHLLKISFAANGLAQCYVDGVLLGSATVIQNYGRTNAWTLNIGNFDGDIDELRISKAEGVESEFSVDANTVALYHFNGNYADATTNGYHMTSAGGVTRTNTNLGWMNNPSGEVVRFTAIGDTLSVPVLDSAIMPGSVASAITIEARIYPRAYKAYGVGNYPVLSLNQAWDSKFDLFDGIWNNPKAPNLFSGSTTLVNNTVWSNSVALNTWHALKITFSGGTAQCYLNGNLLGTVSAAQNYTRTTNWILTLGNFDGDLDEVRISNVVR